MHMCQCVHFFDTPFQEVFVAMCKEGLVTPLWKQIYIYTYTCVCTCLACHSKKSWSRHVQRGSCHATLAPFDRTNMNQMVRFPLVLSPSPENRSRSAPRTPFQNFSSRFQNVQLHLQRLLLNIIRG